jgi:hypothetical protein
MTFLEVEKIIVSKQLFFEIIIRDYIKQAAT